MKKIAFPLALSAALLASALMALPSCRVADDDTEASEAQLAENEFPSLNAIPVTRGAPIVQPTTIVQEPGNNDFFYILEKAGRVLRVPNKDAVDVNDVQVALDFGAQVASGDTEKVTFEEGLLNMVFHPKFRDNQQVFVYYNHGTSQSDLFVRLSRFKLVNGKLSGEQVLIDQKKDRGNHNGGGMVFDKEGLLYIGIGDGVVPLEDVHHVGPRRARALAVRRAAPTLQGQRGRQHQRILRRRHHPDGPDPRSATPGQRHAGYPGQRQQLRQPFPRQR